MDSFTEVLNRFSREEGKYLIRHYPVMLAEDKEMEELHRLLTNFGFMEAKAETCSTQSLIDDYELSNDSILRVIQHALRREAHVLSEYPHLLWQQLYNRLQWEDDSQLQQLMQIESEYRSERGNLPWLQLRKSLPESLYLLRTLAGHANAVSACAFSPDGTMILSSSGNYLKLWDAYSGQELATIHTDHTWINHCAFNPNGTTFLSKSREMLTLWDASTMEKRIIFLSEDDSLEYCTFSPDGTTILTGHFGGTLSLWDVYTGAELITIDIREPSVFQSTIRACGFGPDESTLLSFNGSGALRKWDAGTGQKIATLTLDIGPTTVSAFGQRGSTLLTATYPHELIGWDTRTGAKRFTIHTHHRDNISECALSGAFAKCVALSP